MWDQLNREGEYGEVCEGNSGKVPLEKRDGLDPSFLPPWQGGREVKEKKLPHKKTVLVEL